MKPEPTTLGAYYGGPDDGATRQLTADDLAAGAVESMDAAGRVVRYSIVPLAEPQAVADGIATHRLIVQD